MQDINYTFQLSIEQDRESILEVSVGAADTPEAIAKAKATILSLLNEYTPGSAAAETPTPVETDMSGSIPGTRAPLLAPDTRPVTRPGRLEGTPVGPRGGFRMIPRGGNDGKAPVTLQESEKIARENGGNNGGNSGNGGNADTGTGTGTKGFVLATCSKCGHIFRSFLREPQTSLDCKCGGTIDLTVPLARFEYTCKSCGKKHWGQTNFEDASIEVRCSCGEWTSLDWDAKEKMYRLTGKRSKGVLDTLEGRHDKDDPDTPDALEEQETSDTPTAQNDNMEGESGEKTSEDVE